MSGFSFDFRDIIEEAGDIIVVTKAWPITSPGPEIVYVNKAFTKLTGYSFEEAVGGDPRMLQSADTDLETRGKIRNALINQEPIRVAIKNYSKSGDGYWLDMNILPLRDSTGKVSHFVAIERDVTESKELEFKLDRLARHDSLSGLLNRRAFDELINIELSHFLKMEKVFTVLALDIDHFKAVNDNFGHPAGDRVIQEVSKACKDQFDSINDIAHIARTGGEEFTILLADMDARTAERHAKQLLGTISGLAIETELGLIKITVSIGVSEVGIYDKTPSQILVRADKALYKAKSGGRNQVCINQVVLCDSV